ncbi:hypothetical protein ABIB06_002021 [Bradyrhizobium sp. LB8.2]
MPIPQFPNVRATNGAHAEEPSVALTRNLRNRPIGTSFRTRAPHAGPICARTARSGCCRVGQRPLGRIPAHVGGGGSLCERAALRLARFCCRIPPPSLLQYRSARSGVPGAAPCLARRIHRARFFAGRSKRLIWALMVRACHHLAQPAQRRHRHRFWARRVAARQPDPPAIHDGRDPRTGLGQVSKCRLQMPRNRPRLTVRAVHSVVHSGGHKMRPLIGILVFRRFSYLRGIGEGSPTLSAEVKSNEATCSTCA